jgi:hypothetical protein
MKKYRFYYVTLDGTEPASWSPFGISLSQLEAENALLTQKSEYGDGELTVRLLCKKIADLDKVELSRAIGCLAQSAFLRAATDQNHISQINELSNKLLSVNFHSASKLGFEIYFVLADDEVANESEAMRFKNRLVLSGLDGKLIRVDFVHDGRGLARLTRTRLMNLVHSPVAIAIEPLENKA